MTKGLTLAPVLMMLTACGTNEPGPNGGELQSNMQLHTAQYYAENEAELAETDAICTNWKASQRPPASWPAVVVNNCNNVDAAKTLLMNKADTDKLRGEAGI